jgi:predicted nucleotidyltransferase
LAVNTWFRGIILERLPENARVILEGLLEDLRSRESVSGIGLFGSYSRGDSVLASDIDLLIVDKRDFDYEYVERAMLNNVFFDLDYVPEKWILNQMAPEIDHKLYEAEVLFDRKGILTRAKNTISNICWTPERAEIRTGDYVMEADTYLSRGLSAINKDDFQSACVNATIAFDAIMKILIDVNKQFFSNSHFVRAAESATKKLGVSQVYKDYLDVAVLNDVTRHKAENILASLSEMWNETIGYIEASSPLVETLHVRVKNNLSYYCKESFLKGLQARAYSLIKDGQYVEAAHYMSRTSASMLENYVWLLSSLEGSRFDFTDLFLRLKNSKTSPEGVYKKAVEALGVDGVSAQEANDGLRRTKEIILDVRQKRKQLIAALLT